mmetsp:Transcript_88435/g.156836  ORF Transcript_88435/g.156836 Transcript_88435/m.156836 type:complete len:175 (-) Transcript_88435:146-670(-)|eukprot:CAMPEP_0197648524 /NCGR_PEP_ID=MMETSP1338-20131121/27811_1 /TAXON_ID=43686 ORGANISM="Pelagodinium beii, Strain RCC1491" /NCGR_SAMPLE_ID=MMETSP1338 /ASSEMBLY_ACC=CAM_ASM_000754 /LENGTH=174 /DNA_ID=CAMNT_0043222549 /DNA_START=51 /DNA_END=575 /DNA_ORIENTATION=+
MELRRRRPVLAFALLLSTMQAALHLPFVGSPSARRGSALLRNAAPALAPAPVKQRQSSSQPLPIDETRYGEKVRWLVDREAQKPPEWRVLLLVSGCLVGVLAMPSGLARQKAEHARDHFFSVVAAETEWSDAIRKAQLLQSRGLVVRVVPGTSRSPEPHNSRRSAEHHTVGGRL